MKKIILVLCFLINISSMFVFAEDNKNELGLEYRMGEKEVKEESSYEVSYPPKVSADELIEKPIGILYKIIGLFMILIQPASILGFMISSFIFIYQVIVSNKWDKITGVIVSVAVYPIVLFSPDILNYFVGLVGQLF